MTIEEQINFFRKGTSEIIGEDDLRVKLESGKKLRVKLGADPTAPDIHLGHTVVLRKLKAFQDRGHTAIFLIGDFTGMIGDPTGRNITRPRLSRREVLENAETYKQQIFKILDPKKTEVYFNSDWFNPMDTEISKKFETKAFNTSDFIKLASHATVQQILERKDFADRLKSQKPIALHELLYPLIQGYDSVALKADVELGGTDQKFNLLMGRDLQREYGQEPQVVITMPLLVGTDGIKKMSKSSNNYIGINEPPHQMFRKIMEIPDELIWDYFELVTDLKVDEIKGLKQQLNEGTSILELKKELAKIITLDFNPNANIEEITNTFVDETMKTRKIVGQSTQKNVRARSTTIANLLIESGLVKSLKELKNRSDAKIFFNNEKIENSLVKDHTINILEDSVYKLQFGSKAFDLKGTKIEIQHRDVQSGAVKSFGYDQENQILEIKFETGKAYEYFNVPPKVVEDLEKFIPLEKGLGGYCNKNINNVFSHLEIKE
ncbi:MAG TPA: tyrosine--tRNA ligase [Pyrinomonadaceae bacterium]|jgi:tyrosyl-tRNA synthetase